MALDLGKSRKVKVVDRTLPEIVSKQNKNKRLEIIYFCWLLRDVGVDTFEIDRKVLELIDKLPVGLDFMYRITCEEDVHMCIDNNIKTCIITEDTLDQHQLLKNLKYRNTRIVLQCPAQSVEELEKLKGLKNLQSFNLVNEIRIAGLEGFYSILWLDKLWEAYEALNISINVCPRDKFHNATALCVEALMNDIDSITVSFMGCGEEGGYAPLEEVLMAYKVLIRPDSKIDLGNLPEMSRCFSRLAGVDIPYSKPVIGRDIFKYQSGIHADGIEKSPNTYEPYDPSIVGQRRELTIGKHSGKRAVQKKLKDLGITCKIEDASKMLEYIRQKSTEFKRDLFDYEIIDIYNNENVVLEEKRWIQ